MTNVSITDQNTEVLDRLCIALGCRRGDVVSAALHALNAVVGYQESGFDTFVAKNVRTKRSEIMNMPHMKNKLC